MWPPGHILPSVALPAQTQGALIQSKQQTEREPENQLGSDWITVRFLSDLENLIKMHSSS